MSMLKDVSWGAMILGAGAVIAMVAFAPVTVAGTATTALAALAEATGFGTGAITAGAAVIGATLGNMTSKLLHRAQDSATTLVQR